MAEYKRYLGESEDELIFRICKDKEVIGSWQDVADILNELLGNDYGESTYRKKYAAFQKMFNANQKLFAESEEYIKDIEEQRRTLEREKIKFRDERNAWQRQNRDAARLEEKLDYLESLIKETSPYESSVMTVSSSGTNDILICLSDVHLGLDTGDTLFGEYNVNIAKETFDKYYLQICEIVKRHDIDKAYIALLGDSVNGIIHYTTILENGENVIKQIQTVSELISEFIFKISNLVNVVYVNDVSGNHSRLGKKNEVMRGERLDSIVCWYAKAKLANVSNVKFFDHCKYDPTIAFFNICGLQFILCHGDYDTADASGVQRLTMMIGEVPYAIVIGHRHSTAYSEVSGVKVIQSGTFAGSGSNYCIEHRLVGSPSQAVAVINDDGIKAFYPIQL